MRIVSSASHALLFASLCAVANAGCDCGYTVENTSSHDISMPFTSLIETDFLHLPNMSSTYQTDWLPQNYTITPELARGPYGKNASTSNVVTNPLQSKYDWAGNGVAGGDAGLQLIARGQTGPKGGLVGMAEIVSNRSDILYGSFRAGIRTTGVNGTCGAFFWYFNDTQEIDFEILSQQQNASSHPANLVLQSPKSASNGFDAAKTDTFLPYKLPFDPTQSFHEYRFDWLPTSVSFYADGVLLDTMTDPSAIPATPGHITLSHWSNGDPSWSAGPPTTDAIMTVEYFKGYFNTSSSLTSPPAACKNPSAPGVVCAVPEVTSPPQGNASANTFFFSPDPAGLAKAKAAGKSAGTISVALNGAAKALMWAGMAVCISSGISWTL